MTLGDNFDCLHFSSHCEADRLERLSGAKSCVDRHRSGTQKTAYTLSHETAHA
jgi:hypothetical protein